MESAMRIECPFCERPLPENHAAIMGPKGLILKKLTNAYKLALKLQHHGEDELDRQCAGHISDELVDAILTIEEMKV